MQSIEVVYFNQNNHKLIDAESYQYRPNGRFPKLQKVLFWVLEKLKAHRRYETVSYQRVYVDLDRMTDMIWRQVEECNRHTDWTAKYIIMGAKQFASLVNENDYPVHVKFNIPNHYNAPLYINNIRRGDYFYGMEVIVLPYMDGILVLPSLN
jgi:hypothetical protein